MKYPTDDLRITDLQNVSAPKEILEELPLTEAGARTVFEARAQIREILQQSDDRLMVIVGPCSIHDVEAAHEYAQRLQPVRDRLAEDLLIVMRVYFEKPRTTVGWKGLINDPDWTTATTSTKVCVWPAGCSYGWANRGFQPAPSSWT